MESLIRNAVVPLMYGLCFISKVSGQNISATYHDLKRLQSDILRNYSKDVRPVHDQSEKVNVNVTLGIYSIQEFDEVLERLDTIGWVMLEWKDEILTWDIKDYGGIHMTELDCLWIWTPKVRLINSVKKVPFVSSEICYVLNTGQVFFSSGDLFQSRCHVDITRYPYDVQNCNLQFVGWGFYERFTYLRLDYQSYYLPGGFWELMDSSNTYISSLSGAHFNLVLKRKPEFVMLNVCTPICVVALLSVVVFCIPPESGERISYSLTVLLSLAIFITLVAENIPKTSSPMSVFSYCLGVTLLLTALTTVAVIYNLKLHFGGTKKAGQMWSKTDGCSCTRKRKRKHVVTVACREIHKDTTEADIKHQKEINQDDEHPDNNTEKSCVEISVVMDKIFFVVFLVAQLSVIFVYVLFIVS